MAKAPRGAMSAGNYGSGLLNTRGNPPRYTHLPHAEAWAKIDEEQALFEKQQFDALVEIEVQKKLASMNTEHTHTIKEEEVKVRVVVEEAKKAEEVITVIEGFGVGELNRVFVTLSGLGDIEQASNLGIVLNIDGIKVLISRV